MIYEVSKKLNDIANKVIEENEDVLGYIKEKEVNISFLMCSKGKKSANKTVYAQTHKVSDMYKAYIPYDFIITFYEPSCFDLTPEQLEILMYHELKHVGVTENGFKIIPHDVEDFADVIQRFGIEWVRTF